MIKVQLVKEMLQEEKATRQLHAAERKQLSRIAPSAPLSHPKVNAAAVALNNLAPNVVNPPALPTTQAPIVGFSRTVDKAAANANGPTDGIMVDVGTFKSTATIPADTPWGQAVLNGVANGEVRFPDPFRLTESTITCVQTEAGLFTNSATGDTSKPDSWACGVIQGGPISTFFQFAPAGPTANLDFKYADRVLTVSGGLQSSDFITRPNGIVVEFLPQLRGVEHSITFVAVPTLPTSSGTWTAAVPTGWTAVANQGPSSFQRYLGARTWTFKPGDTAIRLCCLPLDSRSMDFYDGASERQSYLYQSYTSWAGWAWWAYGFTGADYFSVRLRYVEEVMPKSISTGTNYAYPTAPVQANPTLAAKSVNGVMQAAGEGLTGVKIGESWVDWGINKINTIGKVWNAIKPFVGSDSMHFRMPFGPVTFGPLLQRDDEKKDDFTPIDKPRERRNTLPEMLSVDEVRTPRVGKK